MPIRNDGARRNAQTRSESRSARSSGSGGRSASRSRTSTRTGSGSERRSSSRISSRSASQSTSRTAQGSSRQSRSSRQAPRRGGRDSRSANPISSLLERLPSSAVPIAIAAVVLIIVLVLVFAVLVPSCSGSSANSSQQSASADAAAKTGIVATVNAAKAEAQAKIETANQIGSLESSNTKVQALVTLLGEEETAKLLAQAKTNPEALWIAAHPDAYAFEGIETQYKVLKLAADEPTAISFVRQFPSLYPALEPSTDKDLALETSSPSSSVPDTDIPHLYQWDRRWGFTIYGSAAFGLAGGGPTALAMVYQGLVATDLTPYDMAKRAQDGGFITESGETMNALFTESASGLGLSCTEIGADSSVIREELARGHVVIADVGPGTFTTSENFLVLTGLADDGRIIVNDPYSATHSSQTWDADLIANEAYTAFAFSA